MHFAVILTMWIFLSLLWKRKTMPRCPCLPMGQMSGWAMTNSGKLLEIIKSSRTLLLRLCTTTTSTYMVWTHTTQGTNHLLHLSRHVPQDAGKTVIMRFCWIYWRSMLILGSTILIVWRLLFQFCSSRELFSRGLIDNPYFKQDNTIPEARKIKRNKHTNLHIFIKIPRRKHYQQ